MDPLLFRVILGYFSDPLVDDELGGCSPKFAIIFAQDFVEEAGVVFLHSLDYIIQRSRVA